VAGRRKTPTNTRREGETEIRARGRAVRATWRALVVAADDELDDRQGRIRMIDLGKRIA
jgi:hypothetical protein